MMIDQVHWSSIGKILERRMIVLVVHINPNYLKSKLIDNPTQNRNPWRLHFLFQTIEVSKFFIDSYGYAQTLSIFAFKPVKKVI